MKLYLFCFLLLTSTISFAQSSGQAVNYNTSNDPEELRNGVDHYKEQINTNPKDQNAYYGLGMCYYKLLRFKEAIVAFDKLIALNNKYPNALANRGLCKFFLRDKAGACEDFHKSIAVGQDPDDFNGIKGMKLSRYVKANCDDK